MNDIKVTDIQPVGDKIIIELYNRPKETTGGFILPEEANSSTPVLGKILAKGEDSIYDIGDMVFFRRYSVDELKFNVDGKQEIVSLISDEEIVAILKKNA